MKLNVIHLVHKLSCKLCAHLLCHLAADLAVADPDGPRTESIAYRDRANPEHAQSDDGYVLGLQGDATGYYPMPTGKDLSDLQAEGVLPEPLPPYSISTVDYALGYSLWIFLGLVVLFYGVKLLFTAAA